MDRFEASIKARPPSGKVTPLPKVSSSTSISSSEPPPRSPTIPSGLWIADTTPSAESSASRRPERSLISFRIAASAAERKAGPFEASRTAAVAITSISTTPIISTSARYRRRALRAFSTPSSGKRPEVTTPFPRPHITFSLKMGVGARESD